MATTIGKRIAPDFPEDGSEWPIFSTEAHGDLIGTIRANLTRSSVLATYSVTSYDVEIWNADGDTLADRSFAVERSSGIGPRQALAAAKSFAKEFAK